MWRCYDCEAVCWTVLAAPLPVVQEETILDQKIEKKVDKAFHCHESNIFPHKVPPERVCCVLLTWKQKQGLYWKWTFCSVSKEKTLQEFILYKLSGCTNIIFQTARTVVTRDKPCVGRVCTFFPQSYKSDMTNTTVNNVKLRVIIVENRLLTKNICCILYLMMLIIQCIMRLK